MVLAPPTESASDPALSSFLAGYVRKGVHPPPSSLLKGGPHLGTVSNNSSSSRDGVLISTIGSTKPGGSASSSSNGLSIDQLLRGLL